MSVDTNATVPEPEKKAPEAEAKIQLTESGAETVDQVNWRKFREQREQERKERIALEEGNRKKAEEISALKQAVESLVGKPAPAVQSAPDDYELSDEERIAKQVDAAVAAALTARDRETEKQRAAREAQEIPDKLASTFSDFNDVCTTENLDYLEFHYPEVAEAFKNQPESFKKWSNIYRAVKRFIPNTKSNKDAKTVERNMAKPQSMAVKGLTSTGDTAPVKFDDAARSANWARMQRVMKGIG